MTAKPHVLLVIKGLGPGGAERLVVDQLVRESASCTYELFVCTKREPNVLAEVPEQVPVHLGYAKQGSWVAHLRKVVGTGRFDVVHTHLPIAAVGTRLATHTVRNRPKVFYTEHNRWPSYVLPTRLANRATAWLDDVTFAVSQDAAESMKFPLRKPAIVVDHGVSGELPRSSAAAKQALTDMLEIEPESPVIGTVANLRREKAQAALITAFARISVTPAPHLVIVGQGPLDNELRETAAGSGAGDRIHFMGYRYDAPSIAAGFDVFTLPSEHEGRPVALMEALRIGLPVVVSDVGDMPNMVEHGVSGLVVPVRDSDALVEALSDAAGDEALRHRLSAGAIGQSTDTEGERAFELIETYYAESVAPT